MSWQRSIEAFLTDLEQLKDYFLQADIRNDRISAWSVGQHTEHLLLVAERFSETLERDSIGSDQGNISLAGRICFWLGKLPRGKAEAPELVRPVKVSPETFFVRSGQVYAFYATIERLPGGKLKHPVLGSLTAEQWLRFLEIHQRHHLAIMAEITSSSTT